MIVYADRPVGQLVRNAPTQAERRSENAESAVLGGSSIPDPVQQANKGTRGRRHPPIGIPPQARIDRRGLP